MTLDVHASADGRVALRPLLSRLAANGVTRLLVEGGPTMWAAFLAAGLVDELIVAVSPLASTGSTRAVAGGDLEAHFAAYGLVPIGRRAVGPDTLHTFRRGNA